MTQAMVLGEMVRTLHLATGATGEAVPTAPAQLMQPLDPRTLDTVQALNDARVLAKFAKSQEKALKKLLRAELAGAALGTINGVVVLEDGDAEMTLLDRDKLRDGWPEAYEACAYKKPYKVLRVRSAVVTTLVQAAAAAVEAKPKRRRAPRKAVATT